MKLSRLGWTSLLLPGLCFLLIDVLGHWIGIIGFAFNVIFLIECFRPRLAFRGSHKSDAKKVGSGPDETDA